MKTEQPSWQIKGQTCAYCEMGELIFSKCPNCGSLVLICGECSTVYEIKENKIGKEIGDISGSTKCYTCSESPHSQFPCATSEDIQIAGFKQTDYI
ncbi:MAG: hypothetical protein ACSHYA_17000 [Opitutaceae bacterium]